MRKEDVDTFLRTNSQLKVMHREISELSKKKPHDQINKFKLGFINGILKDSNKLLKDYKPFDDFEIFDEDELPSNSDVTIMLSQYLNSLERLRCDNIVNSGASYYWVIDKKMSDFETTRPSLDFKK